MLRRKSVVLFLCLVCLSSAASAQNRFMQPVPSVNLPAYLGTWYEYISIPSFFQRGCTKTTATYGRLSNGLIQVKNRCITNGKVKGIDGSARPIDVTNAKLKVKFEILGLFQTEGDYWVLGLGPINERGQYSWAVVGEPRRKFGWLLSRTKTVSPQTLASAKTILQRAGYDLSKFRKTKQF